MGIRRWPAVVAWSLAVPVVSVFGVLGGQGRVVFAYLHITVLGGLAVVFILWLNSWYFPRLERVIRHPETVIVKDLAGRPLGSVAWLWTSTGRNFSEALKPRDSKNDDIFAVGVWMLYILATFFFDWQTAGFFVVGPERAPVAQPWGTAVTLASYVSNGYFILAGISLLLHYARSWGLLSKWVESSGPESIPQGVDSSAWERWEAQWRVYGEGLKAASVVFFKGFAALLLFSASMTWAWLVLFRQGAGFDPGLIAILAADAVIIPIYVFGPSWAAWKKIRNVQDELRKTAASMLSEPGQTDAQQIGGFPSSVNLVLRWSNENHLSIRHGNPEAAIIAIGTYLLQSMIGVASAVVGLGVG